MKMKYYGHGNRKMKIKALRFKKHLPRTPFGVHWSGRWAAPLQGYADLFLSV